jgi:hypothetical protein
MLALAGVPTLHLKRFMRHSSIAMTDRHYTKLRTTDLRAELERAMERPVALAATGTDGLTPKLTPVATTDASLELLVAALSPAARSRLRTLLDVP